MNDFLIENLLAFFDVMVLGISSILEGILKMTYGFIVHVHLIVHAVELIGFLAIAALLLDMRREITDLWTIFPGVEEQEGDKQK